jgi:hypothetical protein
MRGKEEGGRDQEGGRGGGGGRRKEGEGGGRREERGTGSIFAGGKTVSVIGVRREKEGQGGHVRELVVLLDPLWMGGVGREREGQ